MNTTKNESKFKKKKKGKNNQLYINQLNNNDNYSSYRYDPSQNYFRIINSINSL